jgi:CBS domain-containing protein
MRYGPAMTDIVKVGDLMTTALITAKANDSVDETDVEMRLAAIRHIPVVDDRGHLVGVISNRDLLLALSKRKGKKVSMSEVMTKNVVTISEDATAAEAVDILLERKIGCLPVTGDEGQLVGMITETDFLRVARSALE